MSGRIGEDTWRSAGDQTGNNCCSSNTLQWQHLMNAADRRETNAVPSGQKRRWRRRKGMTQLPRTHSPIPLLLWGHLAHIGIGRGEPGSNNVYSGYSRSLSYSQEWGTEGQKEGLGYWQGAQISGYTQDATLSLLDLWASQIYSETPLTPNLYFQIFF